MASSILGTVRFGAADEGHVCRIGSCVVLPYVVQELQVWLTRRQSCPRGSQYAVRQFRIVDGACQGQRADHRRDDG
jgi:hypothetical protein